MGNPYYHFLKNLIEKEYRKTIHGFAQEIDFESFPAIMNKLKRMPTKKLSAETIGKIEKALQIKIDDRDLNNITYQKVEEKEVQENLEAHEYNLYPVINTVAAGKGIIQDDYISEYIPFIYKKKENCFALKVYGDSMDAGNGRIQDGDYVLIDKDAPITNGCRVAILLKNGLQFLKRYKDLGNDTVMLYSDNPNYEPIIVKKTDIEVIYRVVAFSGLL